MNMGGSLSVKDILSYLSLLAAIVSGALWMGSLSARVDSNERQLNERSSQSDRLARVEQSLVAVNDNLREIKQELRKQNAH